MEPQSLKSPIGKGLVQSGRVIELLKQFGRNERSQLRHNGGLVQTDNMKWVLSASSTSTLPDKCD